MVLGGPAIDWDDGATARAALPSGRAELVFAYLAVEHRRVVSRDELANALWPGLLPDSWAPALRSVVSEVRRFLDDAGLAGHELVAGARGGYQLRLAPGVIVDVDEARAGLAEARDALERGDATGAAVSASRAASIAVLPFLPRHEGEWVQTVREELEAIQAAALELAARAHAQAGDARAAITAAERLIRIEPYSEAAYRLLIEVRGRAGDRAGALQAYRQCRDVLRSELGLEASAETEAVLQQALAEPVPADSAANAATEAAATLVGSAIGVSTADDPVFAAYSVLVVEDHDFQRRAALAVLRRLGVGTLLEAADGAAALELLADTAPPNVIICDIDMPGMDGVEFIAHVARRGLASAVAIVSGLDRHILQTVRAAGEGHGLAVLGALEKPLTARALSDLLARYRPSPPLREDEAAVRLSGDEIAQGLGNGSIVAELAPIADLASGRITAGELLPRWRDPATRLVRPASFAAALESPETTEHLSERLVELGAGAVQGILDAGLELEIAIRLPHARLADDALATKLAAVARGNGAEPRRLVLVVGSTTAAGGGAPALDVLARIRLKGFGLWLDGPRPESDLGNLPFTGVRLAPWLLASAPADVRSAKALHDAVDRARAHGLLVVGAGCDEAAKFALLLEIGASHAQGPFVAGAIAPQEFAAFVSDWTPPGLTEDERR